MNYFDVLVVDGSSFAHRAGGAMLLQSGGENTSVIFGVLNMLRSFITKHTFTEVCVVWDGIKYKETKRRVFPEYKINRPEPNDDDELKKIHIEISRQINELQKVLPALGIKQIRRDTLEADDVIGILCEGIGKKILIISGDKDMFQLVSNNISIFYPPKESFLTPDNFEQEVGVSLDNFIFYKTIVGDPGDNIPGLKGFGDVTAKKLLKAHGPWTDWFVKGEPKEEVLDDLKKNQRQVFLEGQTVEILIRNYTLMSVGYLDAESKDDLIGDYYNQVPAFDEELVKSYFLEKQFNSYLKRFNGWINPFLRLCNRSIRSDENDKTILE